MGAYTVGIAGTAKNTGKTTTTDVILRLLHQQERTVGLTSIGYDGEEIDNITGLPKPRLRLLPGMLVATAEKCLQVSRAELEILENSGVNTPLGPVYIARVKQEGLVVLAGPNKARELARVRDCMSAWHPDIILVDGALNRLAPMVEADGIIIATGAAYSPKVEELYRDTLSLAAAFQRPVAPPEMVGREGNINVILERDKFYLKTGSLLNKETVEEIMALDQQEQNLKGIYIPGIVSVNALEELVDRLIGNGNWCTLTFRNPVHLLVSGEYQVLYKILANWQQQGGRVAVARSLPLLLITVNPFYPAYDAKHRIYREARIDGEKLIRRLQQDLTVPVIDVLRPGSELILKRVLQEHLVSQRPSNISS
ncbi:hypothetical protein [Calderihabitans maritimus]|uniref:Uncharacterized protein n=1 Tax=Calderihabitans maritimus TaxID=1246530 RepID=A0A1Z5HSH7_9FIRM|nr:hypothetical protein [Calderihabitans maritimus]GAW92275.1 hypothetical protein TepRe1_1353 [Calderihabitans maritimus]